MVLHKRVCGSLALVNMIELVSLYKLQAAHRLSLHPAKIINLFPSDTLSPPPTGWIHFKEPKWTKEPGPFTLVDPKEDHMSRTKKKTIFSVFTWFLTTGKSKMAAILVTLQVSSNATTHEIIPSSCREDEKLSTGGKIFSNYCEMSKNARKRIHQPSPPPPCTTVVLSLWVYVRGYLINLSVRSLLTRACLLPLIRTSPLINRLIEKLWQKSSIEVNESATLRMKPMTCNVIWPYLNSPTHLMSNIGRLFVF